MDLSIARISQLQVTFGTLQQEFLCKNLVFSLFGARVKWLNVTT